MTKQQILDAIKEENKILTHLFSKIKSDQMQFSPGEKMRTLEELLRYISYAGSSTIHWYHNQIQGVEDKNFFKNVVDKAAAMDINAFPDALDEQYKEIETLLANYSDDDLTTVKVKQFSGQKSQFGVAIVNSSLKYLTAYRMQLFLYLKLGQPELNTYNCWMGIDPPPKTS